MKALHITIAFTLAFAGFIYTLAQEPQPTTAATFAVSISNATEEADAQAARFVVEKENDRRARQDPPEAALPTTPLASLQASYETVLAARLAAEHKVFVLFAAEKEIEDMRTRWNLSSDAQRAAALGQLEPLP